MQRCLFVGLGCNAITVILAEVAGEFVEVCVVIDTVFAGLDTTAL